LQLSLGEDSFFPPVGACLFHSGSFLTVSLSPPPALGITRPALFHGLPNNSNNACLRIVPDRVCPPSFSCQNPLPPLRFLCLPAPTLPQLVGTPLRTALPFPLILCFEFHPFFLSLEGERNLESPPFGPSGNQQTTLTFDPGSKPPDKSRGPPFPCRHFVCEIFFPQEHYDLRRCFPNESPKPAFLPPFRCHPSKVEGCLPGVVFH